MFGSIYGKAVELFGKPLLVSAFLPLLAVAAALGFSVSPSTALRVVTNWIAKEPAQQASSALILLGAIYLLSFIVYGVRERITRFLSGGEFLVFAPFQRLRRLHFVQAEIEKESRYTGPGLAVAQAATWAKSFGTIDKDYIYLPSRSNAKRLARKADRMLNRLASRALEQRISAKERARIAELLVALHRLAYLDRAEGKRRIDCFSDLCKNNSIDVVQWCEDVKDIDYGDIVAAYSRRLWSPTIREVQPTELGNVLVWAYSYTRKRYGIELEFLFPRLLKVIDKKYQAKIDDRQQFLDFAVILTSLAFAAAIVYAFAATFSIVANPEKQTWEPIAGASAVFLVWLLLGRGAYQVAIVAAHGYVSIITSAVDLFRLPLLEQLRVEHPSELNERETWSRLNESIRTGDYTPPLKPREPKGIVASFRRVWKAMIA